jgi:hypothetical protein
MGVTGLAIIEDEAAVCGFFCGCCCGAFVLDDAAVAREMLFRVDWHFSCCCLNLFRLSCRDAICQRMTFRLSRHRLL